MEFSLQVLNIFIWCPRHPQCRTMLCPRWSMDLPGIHRILSHLTYSKPTRQTISGQPWTALRNPDSDGKCRPRSVFSTLRIVTVVLCCQRSHPPRCRIYGGLSVTRENSKLRRTSSGAESDQFQRMVLLDVSQVSKLICGVPSVLIDTIETLKHGNEKYLYAGSTSKSDT